MDQKELDIQRALGTLNIYWIEIGFPWREETIPDLDQFISKFIPYSIRFYEGLASTFMLEASPAHLKKLLEELPAKIQLSGAKKTRLGNDYHYIGISIFEDQDGERVPIKSFSLSLNKKDESA